MSVKRRIRELTQFSCGFAEDGDEICSFCKQKINPGSEHFFEEKSTKGSFQIKKCPSTPNTDGWSTENADVSILIVREGSDGHDYANNDPRFLIKKDGYWAIIWSMDFVRRILTPEEKNTLIEALKIQSEEEIDHHKKLLALLEGIQA